MSHQVLAAVVEKCLEETNVWNCQSVVFPALGTGNLGYPPAEVAKCMIQTVIDFVGKNPHSSIKLVKILIYKTKETLLVRITHIVVLLFVINNSLLSQHFSKMSQNKTFYQWQMSQGVYDKHHTRTTITRLFFMRMATFWQVTLVRVMFSWKYLLKAWICPMCGVRCYLHPWRKMISDKNL